MQLLSELNAKLRTLITKIYSNKCITTKMIYKTVIPMKVHPLYHGISFHPSLHIFIFTVFPYN